jgi:hypothetical protein
MHLGQTLRRGFILAADKRLSERCCTTATRVHLIVLCTRILSLHVAVAGLYLHEVLSS